MITLLYHKSEGDEMINNIENALSKDEKGNFTQDSFNEMMKYPSTYHSWDKEFNLSSF